ncbi:hypothetical protein DSO57_1023372 [Entomophthora muscae]|uniref:Uncharacterized protein n=1 Tax=Entomophthora muscae TaxID=34485 RepID=A0ACC2RTV4_9FUNG|nr:hypothetical protein DSO57_1023372 [Entomophthora muscae]
MSPALDGRNILAFRLTRVTSVEFGAVISAMRGRDYWGKGRVFGVTWKSCLANQNGAGMDIRDGWSGMRKKMGEKKSNDFALTPASVDSSVDQRTGGTFGAYANIVCVVAGTGTLGLPYAMNQGGWVTAIMFLVVATICTFTSKLLIECLYYKEGERLEEFSDIGRAAFGPLGGYFVKVFQYCITLSAPCIYILLSGLNTHQMVMQFTGHDAVGQRIWILISGLVVAVPVCSMKTLREATILAVFGAFATVVVVLCVVIQGGIQYGSVDYEAPVTAAVKWEGLPLALATLSFSYGGHVVYPHVEATMRNPQQWNRAMLFAVITITAMYLAVAVPGYLYYGETVQSPILDSLPPGAGSITSYILITIHVLLAAPIYLCSFCLEQERLLKVDTQFMSSRHELGLRILLRGSITGVLTLIAIFVPFFSDLMGLVGAIASSIIVFLVPTICHYKLYGFRNRPMWHHPVTLAVVVMGLMGLVLGAISALETLIDHIKNGITVSAHH